MSHQEAVPQSLVSLDFWDPGVLATSNWLEVLDPADFADYPYHGFPAIGQPFTNQQQPADPNASFPAASTLPSRQVDTRSHPHSNSPGSVFSAQSTAVTDGNTSNGTQFDSPLKPGEYYVDGEPARLPRVKRRRTSTIRRSVEARQISTFALRCSDIHRNDQDEFVNINDTVFEEIRILYRQLCIEPSAPWTAFEPLALPQKSAFEHLVGLYFKHFDQTLPFIHRTLLSTGAYSSSLVLAMAAIGCHFLAEDVTSMTLSISMHEFVRRCLLFMWECPGHVHDRAKTAGAEILHIIASAYCGEPRLLKWALDMRHRLAEVFQACKIELISAPDCRSGLGEQAQWTMWMQREGLVRLAYAAWLVDSIIAYTFQIKPFLSLGEAQLELPCPDKLWLANTAHDWQSLKASDLVQPCLNTAMQELFVDKRLPRDRGEFARILMIHGLYQRLWDVSTYLENPLSQWAPTAARQSSTELLPATPVWLPSIPTFTKWQNSSCDALDILHWQANATIGQASGLEHPTVLHLHLARTILLAPYCEMERLARSIISGNAESSCAKSDRHMIQRWATQHQYKARLALIHAGVVFWHVRRYSIDAFHEAPAVGLAALVLWAFGSSASQQPSGEHQGTQPSEGGPGEDHDQSDDAMCEIILIDRPTDDELVQQFIRSGHRMQIHLTGVGNLYDAKGPERALVQGIKLLSSLRCWGVSSSWLQLLQGLVDVAQKGRSGG